MKNIYPRLKSSLKTETCYERKSLETSSTILGRTMFGIFNINSDVVKNYLVLLSVSLSKFHLYCVKNG